MSSFATKWIEACAGVEIAVPCQTERGDWFATYRLNGRTEGPTVWAGSASAAAMKAINLAAIAR